MKGALSFWVLLLTLLLFGLSLYSGYQSGDTDAALALTSTLGQAFSPLRELGPLPLLAVIFLNNSVKALFVILLGAIPFLFSGGFVILNGYILGVVANQAVAQRGIGYTLLALLPHGILELAAILLAAALGLQIGFASIAALAGKKGQLGQQYKSSLVLYLKFVLPALLLAAAIETLVGTYVLRHA